MSKRLESDELWQLQRLRLLAEMEQEVMPQHFDLHGMVATTYHIKLGRYLLSLKD
ncbi:MAG: hypothetical protein MHM6MM_009002 [Cercozoa sp. M6MM]